jgi:multiple sugar transport system permease protein
MEATRRTQMVLFFALCLYTVINLTPIIWAGLTSIKQPVDAFSIPPTIIFTPTFEYHYSVWIQERFWYYLMNSLIISVAVVCISVPIGTLAAYALSRSRTRHTRAILFGLLTVRMFPQILLALPFFIVGMTVHLIDTHLIMVLAIVAINQPFTIWLMRSFLVDVPIELDEAARIDGCNNWQVFWLVVLPVVRPGLVVTALFSLLLSYNEFLFALVLTGSRAKTLPVAIAEYGAEDIAYWSISAAGAIGIMLPIVVFMLFMQRHLVQGLTFGAVKG